MLPTPREAGATAIQQRIGLLKHDLIQGQAALRTAYQAKSDAMRLLRGRSQLVDD